MPLLRPPVKLCAFVVNSSVPFPVPDLAVAVGFGFKFLSEFYF